MHPDDRPRREAPALLAALLLVLAAACLPAPARSQESPLVTDLSSHLISITSSFTGTDLLLFGAVEEPGDVIVVLRGPPQPVVVRRKGRVAGIWLNQEAVRFPNVLGYYAVASSRPVEEIASQALLARLQIGSENLRLAPLSEVEESELLPYKDAIVRAKMRRNLYQEDTARVLFLGPKLFRVRINFPAEVPVGTYRSEVYLVRDDQVIAAQATPLYIRKSGAERAIYDFAHDQPLLYGLSAVLLALFSGWVGAAIFRKH